MAKKKAKKKAPAKTASVMDSFMYAAEKELGAGAVFDDTADGTRHVGVPLPSLSFEFLLGSNVLWLGGTYGIAGKTQTFKSSLAMELMRGILYLGGYGSTIETEGGKVSDVMIENLLGEMRKHHKMISRKTVEDAQQALTFVVSWFEKQFPKKDMLFALMLDSLFGPPGAEKRKTILKEGHASRSYPIEALLWSSWLQTFCPGLMGHPIIFMFVNHLKKDTDGGAWRHPGGDSQDFYSTVYMHVSKVRTYEGSDEAISQLQIKTVKHSYFLPGRKINVPYVFDKEKNKLYFDWGHSTADMLSGDLVPTKVKDVLKVSASTASMTALTRRFSCKDLGMKDVTGAELGAAVHANKELVDELRPLLGINMYDVWGGLMPVQLEKPKEDEPADLDDADDDALDI